MIASDFGSGANRGGRTEHVAQAQFGAWLKQQRKSRRLTQEDLAERLACSSVLIQKIEAGERSPSAQLVSLLGDWLGIPTEDRPSFLNFARGMLHLGDADRDVEAKFGYAAGIRKRFTDKLPVPLTSFVGRADDVERVDALLRRKEVRLLTLTGTPGIGKTRLALEVARNVTDRFRDGVYFVSLAPVIDPDLVVNAIVHALEVQVKGGESLVGTLQQSLNSKELLLVLDNFEQVLDASPLVLELLSACPGLKILTTSREALYVHGEQQYHVPPLATVDPTNLPAVEKMENIPAIALFVERAQDVKPDFALIEQNAKAIAAICARLDGLPLAIELAAAHVRLLSPQEMQTRLESRLELPAGGPRNLPARHRTLRAALDWSYNLLNEEEQTLFARLGVFVGGFTLPAAQAICGVGEGVSSTGAEQDRSPDIGDRVESLLDKNLLKQQEGADGEWRFGMLALIHDYSLERLQASGEEENVRSLHAAYYLNLAEAAAAELLGANQKPWLEKFEREHNNIQSVLRWSLNSGNATLALRLGGAMRYFWYMHGHSMEGRRWLEEAVAAGSDAPASVRALGLRALGHLAQQVADYKRSTELCEESLALYRQEGDLAGIAGALQTLSFSYLQQGDPERAFGLGKEALEIGFDPAMGSQTTRLLFMLGAASWFRGDFAQAEEFGREALALSRRQANDELIAAGLNLLGVIAHFQDDYTRAEALYRESISVAKEAGAVVQRAHPTVNMGDLAVQQGDYARAGSLLNQGLRMFVDLGDKQGIAEALEGMSCLAGARGQAERAAHLYGAAEAIREANNVHIPAFVVAVYESFMAASRSQLGEEAFAKAWSEGRKMAMEQATDYALAKPNALSPPTSLENLPGINTAH